MAKGLSITSNQRNEKQENKKIPTHICACFFYLEDSLCHILQTYPSDWLYLFLVSLCSLKEPKSNDTLVAISTFSTKILVSKSHSLLKGARTSCRKWPNLGEGKVQDELRVSCAKY